MKNSEEIKEMVKQKYSEIALQDKESNESSCCGSGGCSTEVYNIMSEDYNELKGYELSDFNFLILFYKQSEGCACLKKKLLIQFKF